MTPSENIVASCPYCGDPCPVGYGKCHCGCKRTTNPVSQNKRDQGLAKGVPCKFVRGHQNRKARRDIERVEIDGKECCWIDLGAGKRALVDGFDLHKVDKYTWYPMWSKDIQNYYAATRIVVALGEKKTVLMHRLIIGLGDPRKTDHREPTRTLDNRRINLRPASDAESIRNRRIQKNNTSGTCGVRFDKSRNKWRARIKVNGKEIHLGYFDTREEAVAARKAAEVKYFGEFAYKGQDRRISGMM